MLLSLCCALIHVPLYGSQSNDKIKIDVRGGGQCNFSNPTSIWASSRENLSLGFPTKRVSNQSPQLQRLARN